MRISPLWWPLLILVSPILLPLLLVRNFLFNREKQRVEASNLSKISKAAQLDLPELDYIKLTAIVEGRASEGYLDSPGVSYFLETNLGSMLFDLGHGPDDGAFAHNTQKINLEGKDIQSLAISHFHPDHIGGLKAMRSKTIPRLLSYPKGITCFTTQEARGESLKVQRITEPCLLHGGIGTTGPLEQALFTMGTVEEQALLARVKGTGTAIITGCGHPGVTNILNMAEKLSSEPIFALAGGLHLPISDSPMKKMGLKIQQLFGTGKPPWKKLTEQDLSKTLNTINSMELKELYFSGHDSCDQAINSARDRFQGKTVLLKAGESYCFGECP